MDVPRFARRKLRAFATSLGIKRPRDISAFAIDSIPASEKSKTDLHRLFYCGGSSRKWTHYLDIYDKHLARYRGQNVRLLEIGVAEGGSLALWRGYLGPKATIFGIDIDPQCIHLNGQCGQVRIGSQDNATFLRSVVSEMGGLDVVIDDGSHIARHQRASFDVLFPLVSETGLYITEDLHTSYWRRIFQGGYRRRGTFIEFIKTLMDDVHADFHFRSIHPCQAHRTIGGIHFYNSIVVIEKHPQKRPAHAHGVG